MNLIFIMKMIKIKIYIILFIVITLECNHINKNDYQDDFNESLLLTALLTPEPNPVGKCITMMSKASECLPNASDKDISLLNSSGNSVELYTIYKVSQEILKLNRANQSENPYNNFCSSAISAQGNASNAFKDCNYTCQAENWSYYVSNNLCASGKTTDLFIGSLGVGQNKCAIKCAKTTNN